MVQKTIKRKLLKIEPNNESKSHSPSLEKVLKEMEEASPFERFKRWINLQIWLLTCKTRKFWDRSYSGYIFKKKNKK